MSIHVWVSLDSSKQDPALLSSSKEPVIWACLQMPPPLEEVGTAADISDYLHGLSIGDSTHPICERVP